MNRLQLELLYVCASNAVLEHIVYHADEAVDAFVAAQKLSDDELRAEINHKRNWPALDTHHEGSIDSAFIKVRDRETHHG
jgi:glutaredoxin-related protein